MGDVLVAASLEDDCADGIILITKSSSFVSVEPKSHNEAMRADSVVWGATKARELENHRKNETFQLVDRSATTGTDAKRKGLVPLTWAYKRKRSGDLKAILCVVGCAQRPGVDFDHVTCCILRASNLRLLAALEQTCTCVGVTSKPRTSKESLRPENPSIAARRRGTPLSVTTEVSSCGGLSGPSMAWPKRNGAGSAVCTRD